MKNGVPKWLQMKLFLAANLSLNKNEAFTLGMLFKIIPCTSAKKIRIFPSLIVRAEKVVFNRRFVLSSIKKFLLHEKEDLKIIFSALGIFISTLQSYSNEQFHLKLPKAVKFHIHCAVDLRKAVIQNLQ